MLKNLILAAVAGLLVFGSVAGRAAENGEVVSLPAFVVDGADGKAVRIHWYYAELPGLAVLSCCSMETTESLVGALRDQVRLYRWMLPPDIAIENGGPLLVILDDRPSTSLRLMLNAQQAQLREAGASRVVVVGAAIVDWDFSALFRQQGRMDPTRAAAAFVADAASAMLSRRAGWDHIERVVSRARLNVTAVGNGVDVFQSPATLREQKLPLPSVTTLFAPNTSAVESGQVASQEELARWFARWALFADDGSRQPMLWKFARATASQPRLDDEMAQYYFGISAATMDVYVSRFRQRSQSNLGLHLRLPPVTGAPLTDVRDATEEEVACGIIQWCLLAARYQPGLKNSLIEASRRAIERARQAKEITGKVEAMAGLVELAAGNAADARVLLEDVATEPKLNARARYEVARLRFSEASDRPAGSLRKFSAAQAAGVLDPLAPFLSDPPASAEPLSLIVQTWTQSEKSPTKEDVRLLAAAAKLFPFDEEFQLLVTNYCALNGFSEEAAAIAAIGYVSARTEEARARFNEIRKR